MSRRAAPRRPVALQAQLDARRAALGRGLGAIVSDLALLTPEERLHEAPPAPRGRLRRKA